MPGTVEILVVPAVIDSLRAGDLTSLQLDEALVKFLEDHLDQYRLLTTILRIREPNYLGVQVRAEIVVADFSEPRRVQARVIETLQNFINPLPTAEDTEQWDDLMSDGWEGWPFGRDLYIAEIFSLLQRVPGVKHVLDVQLSERVVIPSRERPPGEEDDPRRRDQRLTPVEQRVLRVPSNTVLCSLEHEITIAELDESHD